MKSALRQAFCLLLCFALSTHSASATIGVLQLPAALQAIGEEAFYANQSLREAVLPPSIVRIESRAFACSSIRRVNLPASIAYIADDAFEGCNLEYAVAEGDYCKKWCADHGVKTASGARPDPYEGEPYIIF